MSMIDIDFLKNEVEKKGKIIGAPKALLLVHEAPLSDGTPYVEIKGGDCFYVSSERGHEIFRHKIASLDDLLYRIFDRITMRMAIDYELDNRVTNQDCRRIIFDKKLELLGRLDNEWRKIESDKIRHILQDYPYSDQ